MKFTVRYIVRMDIRVSLLCGLISLRNADLWVIDHPMVEILLGRPLLKAIGLDLDKLITELCIKGDEEDLANRHAEQVNSDMHSTSKISSVGHSGIRFDQNQGDLIAENDSATENEGIDEPNKIEEDI